MLASLAHIVLQHSYRRQAHEHDSGSMTLANFVHSFATVGVIAVSTLQAQPSKPLDKELREIVRDVVVNSLHGGGWQEDQIFVARDSASFALLVSANVPATYEPTKVVTCPGSTTGTTGKILTNLGYWVKVDLEKSDDTAGWILSVNKSCQFVYQGRDPRGFLHGGTWEIRKVNGSWRIVRQLRGIIT